MKRRWFRYSLRSFFLVVTLIGIFLGWKINVARKQRDAVRAFQSYGATVRYDYEFDIEGPKISDRKSPNPHWLVKYLGVDFFHDVVIVENRSGPPASDFRTILPHLAAFPRLRAITILAHPLKDDDLQFLASCKELSYILLAGNQINGTGFRHFATLPELERLIVQNPISNEALQPLVEVPNLRMLDLRGNKKLTDAAIDVLAKISPLEALSVDHTQITVEGALRLKKLRPKLQLRDPILSRLMRASQESNQAGNSP
jgi:hypothetical protein